MSITAYMGKPGQGMTLRHLTPTPDTARNRAQWLSIADFLVRQNFRDVMRARKRAEVTCAAAPDSKLRAADGAAAQGAAHSLPVGNHGEIVAMGVGA